MPITPRSKSVRKAVKLYTVKKLDIKTIAGHMNVKEDTVEGYLWEGGVSLREKRDDEPRVGHEPVDLEYATAAAQLDHAADSPPTLSYEEQLSAARNFTNTIPPASDRNETTAASDHEPDAPSDWWHRWHRWGNRAAMVALGGTLLRVPFEGLGPTLLPLVLLSSTQLWRGWHLIQAKLKSSEPA